MCSNTKCINFIKTNFSTVFSLQNRLSVVLRKVCLSAVVLGNDFSSRQSKLNAPIDLKFGLNIGGRVMLVRKAYLKK